MQPRRDIGHQVRRLQAEFNQAGLLSNSALWNAAVKAPAGADQWLVGGIQLANQLLAIATLVVSIVMTGLTFFALNGIQTKPAWAIPAMPATWVCSR